jgi:septum formation topological specificity factor MinE
MALRLIGSRLSAGRGFATGIARAVSGGSNAIKPASYLGSVRRFSAGTGNNSNSGQEITKGCLLGAGLVVHGLGLGYIISKYVDTRLGSLEASSSTLSDEAKAELRQYADMKFSEARLLTKSLHAEAKYAVVQNKKHVDGVVSETREELKLVLAQHRAAEEKKLAQLTREIERIQGDVRNCNRKLDSALVQQSSRATEEGKNAELSGEVAELRQEFQRTEQKLNTALSQVSSRVALLLLLLLDRSSRHDARARRGLRN